MPLLCRVLAAAVFAKLAAAGEEVIADFVDLLDFILRDVAFVDTAAIVAVLALAGEVVVAHLFKFCWWWTWLASAWLAFTAAAAAAAIVVVAAAAAATTPLAWLALEAGPVVIGPMEEPAPETRPPFQARTTTVGEC